LIYLQVSTRCMPKEFIEYRRAGARAGKTSGRASHCRFYWGLRHFLVLSACGIIRSTPLTRCFFLAVSGNPQKMFFHHACPPACTQVFYSAYIFRRTLAF